MNDKAYLVLTVDTTTMPPTVVGAAVYSSPASGLTTLSNGKAHMWVTALEAYSPGGYGKAKESLYAVMRAHPAYRWLVPLFDFTTGRWSL